MNYQMFKLDLKKAKEPEIKLPTSIGSSKKQPDLKMGKTRDLFKKTRDAKETFHAKMSTIKDRNGMDLTEAEDIKNT